MAKSVYRVWLDDEKMQRYRQAYRQAKDRHQLIIIGIFVLYLVIFVVSMFATLFFLNHIENAMFFFLVAILFWLFSVDKMGDFFDQRLPDFLRRHSAAYSDWWRQQEAKTFGDKFVKRAVKAGCEPQKAVDAMVPFLAGGDISYAAFDGYCREQQMKADKQAADEADQERQRQYRQRYEKAAGHLQKKFLTPAADTAEQ